MIKDKIGVIPAAGMGTRLGLPFSKELFPIYTDTSYTPIILKSIQALKKIGINEIVVIINWAKNDIIKYLGNGKKFEINITYVVQNEPKSLPQAIKEAYHLLEGKVVYFLMPDTLIEPNDFLVEFDTKPVEKEITLGLFKTTRPDKFGMVNFQNDLVTFMEEKNSSSKLEYMWGFMRWKDKFSKAILNFPYDLESKETTMSDVVNNFLLSGDVGFVKLDNYKYRDLGTFDEIEKYFEEIFNRKNQI